MGLPIDSMRDFSDLSNSQMFVYAWLDSKRGCGSHVHYEPTGVAARTRGLASAPPPALEHAGDFKLTLHVNLEELDLVKIMCCVRMKDEVTNNTRVSVVSTGAMRLEHIVMGLEETATISSAFSPGCRTEIRARCANAGDFANSKMSISPTEGLLLPLIRFKPSALWRMAEVQDHLKVVSDTLKLDMDKFKVEPPLRAEAYVEGITRYRPPPSPSPVGHFSIPRALLFCSLCLGTPAYVFIPFSFPAGSSVEPNSTTGHRTSPPS